MTIVGDATILVVIQGALLILLLFAIGQALRAKRRTGIVAVVTRGDKSMSFLYVFYGVATVVYTLITQVAEAATGYKVVIVTADYLALTYLCFFNSWFRNKLIGLYGRIQKD